MTDAVGVLTEMARRFGAGDPAGAVALFSPDIRIEQPVTLPHGGWHHGPEGMAEMGRRFAEHWERTIAAPRIIGGSGAATAVQVTTQVWTAKRTGRSATVDVVEIMTVSDGLVQEIRVFQQDTHLLLGTLESASGHPEP